jgi:signal transduction histidine kinase
MKLTLRTLLQPVDTDQIPALKEYMGKAAAFALWAYVVTYGLVALAAVLGIQWGQASRAVVVVASGAVALVALRSERWGSRSEWILTCIHALVAALTAWEESPFYLNASLMPLLGIVLVPLRPSACGLLGLAGASSLALRAALAGPGQGGMFWGLAAGTLLIALVAGLITQAQRHMWRELDSKRHQLIAADRLSTLGQHMAGIAHELKTPIAATLNELQGLGQLVEELRDSIGHPEVQEEDLVEICNEMLQHVNGLRSNANRTARFVRAIREHTRDLHKTDHVLFSAWDRLEAVSALLEHRIKKSPVNLDLSAVDRHAQIRGDGGRFDQIFINLISNAFEACEESGSGNLVEISTQSAPKGVTVVVQDNGPGVPEGLREKIFEPLFTTRATSTGTGLGLAVCRDIVQGVFGGTLELVPSPKGARFEVFFPRRAAPEEQAADGEGHRGAYEPFAPTHHAQTHEGLDAGPATLH